MLIADDLHNMLIRQTILDSIPRTSLENMLVFS